MPNIVFVVILWCFEQLRQSDAGIASNLYGTHMDPMWTPIWAVQPGSIWVPYGLAHVNKIK